MAVPPGSRRKGDEPDTVQDLALTPRVIRCRQERWVTPEGQEIVAPLPEEVTGHFGSGVAWGALQMDWAPVCGKETAT